MQSCLVGQPISQTEIGACGQGSEIFSLSDHWVERVPIVMLGMFHHHRQHQWDQCPQDGDRVGELDPKKPVYINCHSGLRSYIACRILSQHGFTCYNLSGGWRFYDLVKRQQKLDTTPAHPCGLPINGAK